MTLMHCKFYNPSSCHCVQVFGFFIQLSVFLILKNKLAFPSSLIDFSAHSNRDTTSIVTITNTDNKTKIGGEAWFIRLLLHENKK